MPWPYLKPFAQVIGERFAGDSGNLRLNQSKVLLSQAAGASQQVTATSHPKMDRLLQVCAGFLVNTAKKLQHF